MGYPRDLCAGDANIVEQLICPICYNVLEDPVIIMKQSCMHKFCRKCVLALFVENNFSQNFKIFNARCPDCRTNFFEADLVPDRTSKAIIDTFKWACTNEECEVS